MEMNTRLQVEHPVTEMITGLDLVEWQLRVATGEPLPCTQDQLHIHGHALEARLYAENPGEDFRPSTGTLHYLSMPPVSSHVRVDSGVEQGDEITSFYDPMIAKLIVWDIDRERALAQMQRALAATRIVGVENNVAFLQRLLASPSFTAAHLDTGLIERERTWLASGEIAFPAHAFVFAALAQVLSPDKSAIAGSAAQLLWARQDGWRVNSSLRRELHFTHSASSTMVSVEYQPAGYLMQIDDRAFDIASAHWMSDQITAVIDGVRQHATVVPMDQALHVFWQGNQYDLHWLNPLARRIADAVNESSMLSPIPGILKALLVNEGEPVEKGTPLLVMEAMKMEYTIVAPAAGQVTAFFFAPGDQVQESTQLLEFERSTVVKGPSPWKA